MAAILGKKLGMSQIFTEGGDRIPVTVIEAGPCTVTQVKTVANDGYEALQIGFGDVKENKLNKPKAGHFKKAGVAPKRHLAEIRCDLEEASAWVKAVEAEEKKPKSEKKAKAKAKAKQAEAEEKVVEGEEAPAEAGETQEAEEAPVVEAEKADATEAEGEAAEGEAAEEVQAEAPQEQEKEAAAPREGGPQAGDLITVEAFAIGQRVKVTGVSKGKGFAGVIKRHGFAGGPASHGAHFHRAPGSVGASAYPSRVFKGMKLPGQMGNKQSTQLGLEVVATEPEQNLIMVKGAVPGSSNAIVFIQTH